MSAETAKMVACAIVSSRLDYCNSVLAGISEANFNKLERVTLACVVTDMPAYSRDHTTPVLAKLHWLPIRARVSFKIAMIVFKIRQTRQAILPGGTDRERGSIQELEVVMSSRDAERVKNCVDHWWQSFPSHCSRNVELSARQC